MRVEKDHCFNVTVEKFQKSEVKDFCFDTSNLQKITRKKNCKRLEQQTIFANIL